jgi:hypothetical protein
MTPKFDVVAVTASHSGTNVGRNTVAQTLESNYQEVLNILNLMGLNEQIKALRGCTECLPNENTFVGSEASHFIVDEAMRDDSRPLFIVCQGAITNVADAFLIESQIADKIIVIWIGGASYPEGGFESNACNDLVAANVIMDSTIELWQVPSNVYSSIKVSFATLYERVLPYGEIGKYLVENTVRVSKGHIELVDYYMSRRDTGQSKGALAASFPGGESWQLGDSPGVGLLLTDHAGHYKTVGAPRFDYGIPGNSIFNLNAGLYLERADNLRKIRVYDYVDSHFILDDFFAKIKYYFS